MKENDRKYVLRIIKILKKKYENVKCALNFSNPFELLVATILSARCRDDVVNNITDNLFKKYIDIKDYANANVLEFENFIRSSGFYKNKSKNIINSACLIINKHNSIVPRTMRELIELPGVARKTANVVLSFAFKKIEGIIVDTHVIRISNLLKLTDHVNSIKVEKDLINIIPKIYWLDFSFLTQRLGKTICKASNRYHSLCPLNDICRFL
ncbi:MAG: endonuclease III [Endomicrobium sp.]|jgi:endonuclease-3|nr:endonuclease III [Endomicrobium sp.]